MEMGPLLIPEISIPRGLAVLKWKWARLLLPEISRLAKSRLLAQPPYSSRTRSALTCVKGGSPDSFEPFQNRCVVEFPLCASSVRVESAYRVCRAAPDAGLRMFSRWHQPRICATMHTVGLRCRCSPPSGPTLHMHRCPPAATVLRLRGKIRFMTGTHADKTLGSCES